MNSHAQILFFSVHHYENIYSPLTRSQNESTKNNLYMCVYGCLFLRQPIMQPRATTKRINNQTKDKLSIRIRDFLRFSKCVDVACLKRSNSFDCYRLPLLSLLASCLHSPTIMDDAYQCSLFPWTLETGKWRHGYGESICIQCSSLSGSCAFLFGLRWFQGGVVATGKVMHSNRHR